MHARKMHFFNCTSVSSVEFPGPARSHLFHMLNLLQIACGCRSSLLLFRCHVLRESPLKMSIARLLQNTLQSPHFLPKDQVVLVKVSSKGQISSVGSNLTFFSRLNVRRLGIQAAKHLAFTRAYKKSALQKLLLKKCQLPNESAPLCPRKTVRQRQHIHATAHLLHA